MPKISLRAYNREIENLIEKGQTDEAIAHCRHILKFYPKHIDTYRLLGKAFLEAQRYAEAADIFHRVLSSVPDDFISQIGMSIIREDEGNLDAAIWHMERAFETQPSNTAIQDELRRLYGRRDGIEPPRIRLSRGALIRMYARGELYPQAIAEARAALAEDPNRIDLLVILARMYYLSGQKVAATEVCTQLVSKLPYCFEANRILAEILPTTSRAQDAAIYRQRVIAMDPYLAHLTPGMLSPLEVPDNAVTLDHLEWSPELEAPAQPEWTRTVGVSWLVEDEEALPDWYSALHEQPTPEMPPSSPEATLPLEESEPLLTEQVETSSSEAEDLIPDWMREAGWEIRAGGAEAQETPLPSEEISEPFLEPGEVPEWLQEIAPPDLGAAEEELPTQAEAWFENLLQSGASQPTPIEEESTIEPLMGPEDALTTPPAEEEPPPSWLADLASSETPSQHEEMGLAEGWGVPEWLSETPEEVPSQPEVYSPTEAVTQTPEKISPEEYEAPTAEAIFPEVEMIAPSPEVPPSGTISEITPPEGEDIEAALAWLESLAARQGAEEGTLITSPSERPEEPPAWVREAQAGVLETAPATQPEDTLPAFESPLAPEMGVPEEPAAEEVPSPEISMASGEEVPLDEEAAFAWLESLAARQGADEETLITPPEQRAEIPPAWVSAQVEESPIASSAITEETPTTSEPPIEEPLPEVSTPTEPPQAATETIPEWLQEVLEPPVVPPEEMETTVSTAAPEPFETIEDTQPVRLATPEPTITAPPAESEAPVPEWLAELVEPSPAIEEEERESIWVPEEIATPEATSPQPLTPPGPESGLEDTLLWLHEAQSALQAGNLERALQFYQRLIQGAYHLEDVIHDLHEALYRFPIDVGLWQALGDAYVRSNRLQDALEAYTKAEELLR